jgi:hypothetical protein
LDAVKPVAELEPEVAAVAPVDLGVGPPGVGASATLTPDFELAAPESCTEVECWLSTARVPLPPPTTPELSCVLVVFVSAEPAEAEVEPLRAAVADSGVADAVGALAGVAAVVAAELAEGLGDSAVRGVRPAALESPCAAVAESGVADPVALPAGLAAVAVAGPVERLGEGAAEGAVRGVAAGDAEAGVLALLLGEAVVGELLGLVAAAAAT